MSLRLCVFIIALGLMLPSISHSQTFQKRTAVEKDRAAKFAVRNPGGKIKFKAVFVVTAPGDKQYHREKDGTNDEGVEVEFPIDFDAKDVEPGKYEWRGVIKKKGVASDHFNPKETSSFPQ
jgi:hypothetical protein